MTGESSVQLAPHFERTLTVRKGYRSLGIVCLVFFLIMAIGSPIAMMIDAPANRRVILAVVTCAVWLFFDLLAAWTLASAIRDRWTVSDDRIIHDGVFRSWTFMFHALVDAQWSIAEFGRLTLRSETNRFKIPFHNFEQADRLWMIQTMRSTLPVELQSGWEEFADRVDAPLRRIVSTIERTPGPGEFRLTRGYWDKRLIPTVVVCCCVAGVLMYAFDDRRWSAVGMFPFLLWFLLRIQTPRRGVTSLQFGRQTSFIKTQFLFSGWAALGIIGALLLQSSKLTPLAEILLLVIYAIILGLLLRNLGGIKANRHVGHDIDRLASPTDRSDTT